MSDATPSVRMFLACAPQDLKFAELITARARADQLPIAFDTLGEGRTDEIGWQLECSRRIRGARVIVVLVSPHTRGSARVKWQVQCARELGLAVLGITVGFGDEAESEGEALVSGGPVVGWKWKTIAATLMRLAVETPPAVDRAGLDSAPRPLASEGSAA